MESDAQNKHVESPTNSQQTSNCPPFLFLYGYLELVLIVFNFMSIDLLSSVSDDDEIDYSVKPEFYDPEVDAKDEIWAQKLRKGRQSDAVLSCPACFTTLCLECQRHEKYVTQYRAIFVVNCKIGNGQVREISAKPKKGKRRRESSESEEATAVAETCKPVCCCICSTNVGIIDEDEVYHFFNVLPSES
ncbi:hypothetical protein Dsin_009429 [Dipteronia sinensis]|uniref:E2F-associated phosphoprotein n=1 Tax=Dipteronia sinensis TaxID=43782 RepID=A0AAE0ARV2_9ROSI|nr:hypothetical protein Dsin_009429 [Dipteronia sinensis]